MSLIGNWPVLVLAFTTRLSQKNGGDPRATLVYTCSVRATNDKDECVRTDVLCSENGEDLARRCAVAWGGQLATVPRTDPEAAIQQEPGVPELLAAWDGFLKSERQETRYNSSRRFVERATVADAGRTQSMAALISTDRPRALIVGTLNPRDAWHGVGQLFGRLPGMASWAISPTGIVTDGSAEAVAAVVDHLNELLRSRVLKRIEIANLKVESDLYAALDGGLDGGCRIKRRRVVRFRRRLRDAETGEPIQINSAKTLQDLRRRQRKLEKELDGDLEYVKVTSPDKTDWLVKNTAQIVAQTYHAAIGSGITDDDAMRDFLRQLAVEGTMRGYLFLGKGQPIAYWVGNLENGNFEAWATSFLPEYSKFSPGNVLLNRVFEDLTEEGAELFDLGYGESAYKRIYCDLEVPEETLHIYGPAPVTRTAFLVHVGFDRLLTAMRDVLVRSGRLDQLRKLWRTVLRRIASS